MNKTEQALIDLWCELTGQTTLGAGDADLIVRLVERGVTIAPQPTPIAAPTLTPCPNCEANQGVPLRDGRIYCNCCGQDYATEERWP